jgi:hypothetical protein
MSAFLTGILTKDLPGADGDLLGSTEAYREQGRRIAAHGYIRG